jgi:hypothetical protein
VTWGALSPHTFTRDYPNPFCDKQTKQALEILLRFPTQLYCVSCQDSWLADQETKQLAQNDPSSYLKEKSIFQVFDQEKPHAISAEALFKFLQHPNSLKFFFPNTKPLPKAHLST